MSRRRGKRSAQRGGQASVVSKPLNEWITALTSVNILGNPNITRQEITQKGVLGIGDPSVEVEQPGDYFITGVTKPIDYRALALRMAGNDLFAQAQQTREDIQVEVNRIYDPGILEPLKEYENALRNKAGIDEIETLGDESKYPLMLWILAANYAGNVDVDQPLVLIPPETIQRLTLSSTESPLSETAPRSP